MTTARPAPAALDGVRVVDLTTPAGELTGRILADLGAEVIKVEPPGGAPARCIPPFIRGRAGDPDGSLFWAAVALGKRSVMLDLDDPVDRARLLTLIKGADVLVESATPGEMDRAGLGYEALRPLNPGLIYVSVTPYGQTGPDAASPATDLTLEAASGLLGLQGDRDRPPVPVGYPQAAFHGAAQAAADAVLALYERERSGLGQHVDTSMQAAMVWTTVLGIGYPPFVGSDPPGSGEGRRGPPREVVPGVVLPTIVPVKDGWVLLTLTLGEVGNLSFAAMMAWAAAEGALDPDLGAISWRTWLVDVREGRLAAEQMRRGLAQLLGFLRGKTKRELQDRAAAARLLLAAAYTPAELLADPQLADRQYWQRVDGLVHPGPWARLSATPLRYRAAAPAPGADQHLLAAPRAPAAPAVHPDRPRGDILAGVKVADFAWVGVGPLISRALADHGATVVRVESETRIDVLRLIPPFKDNLPGIHRGHTPVNFNTSKLGLALNLATPQGYRIARRLVDWADVVVESFTPGTMARLGLDYATLSKDRPDLVMLSTCLRGQTGRESGYTGFGAQGAALAGFVAITGWPDRPPCGPAGAYTDFIAPRFGVAALAAALYHRQRTGRGQYIEQSQVESSIHLLAPLVLDAAVNGRDTAPHGHDSDRACPHGVYATAGVERYIAIAVETPAQWQALRAVAPLDDFAAPELADLQARLACRAELDNALRAWCCGQEPFVLAERLKRAGVPASVVLRLSDLYTDPQLAHRDFFVTFDHPELGPVPVTNLATRFSATPGRPRSAGPCIGQHTWYVLHEILGMAPDEIAALSAAGVLS
jgi:crotonobetainyl-CoA:carnitine CoA-transferase CaiB-like acyl-CoA transferase